MYCSKCGKQIDEDSRFCPYCGESVMASPAQKAPDERKKAQVGADKPQIPVMLVTGGVVAVLVLVVSCVFLFKSLGNKDTEQTNGLAEEASGTLLADKDGSESEVQTILDEESQASEEVDASLEVEPTATPEPEETVYTISTSDIRTLMDDFFRLQANCIAKYYELQLSGVSESRDKPYDAIDMINKYQGVIYTDSRNALLEDYDVQKLKGLEDIQSRIGMWIRHCLNNYETIHYVVGTQITDSNIYGSWNYYSGTNQTIGVQLKYYFYYSPDSFSLSWMGQNIQDAECIEIAYVYAVLVNCGEDVWGIEYLAVNNGGLREDEELFPEKLRDEDEVKKSASAIADITDEEFKKIMNEYFAVAQGELYLFDFNNSNVPFFFTGANGGYVLYHYENGELVKMTLPETANLETIYFRSDSSYLIITEYMGASSHHIICQYQDGSLVECGDFWDDEYVKVNQIVGTNEFWTEYESFSRWSDLKPFNEALEDYQTRKNNEN